MRFSPCASPSPASRGNAVFGEEDRGAFLNSGIPGVWGGRGGESREGSNSACPLGGKSLGEWLPADPGTNLAHPELKAGVLEDCPLLPSSLRPGKVRRGAAYQSLSGLPTASRPAAEGSSGRGAAVGWECAWTTVCCPMPDVTTPSRRRLAHWQTRLYSTFLCLFQTWLL